MVIPVSVSQDIHLIVIITHALVSEFNSDVFQTMPGCVIQNCFAYFFYYKVHIDWVMWLWSSLSPIIDINECKTENGNCAQACHNTKGSYHCTCFAGYSLDTDQYNCSGTTIN